MSKDSSTPVGVKWHDGNYFRVPNDVVRLWGRILGADGIAVYAALASWANNDTADGWTSHEWLADHLDLSADTVGLMIRDMVSLGLIAVERERNPETKQYTRTFYTLLAVKAPTIALEDAPRKIRERQRQEKRQLAKNLQASVAQTKQNGVGYTEPSGKPTTDGSVDLQVSVRQYKDSSGDKDLGRNKDSGIAAPKNSAAPPAENPIPLPFQASDPAGKQPPEPAKEKTTRGAPKARARKPKAAAEDAAKAEREGLFDAHVEAVTGQGPDGDEAKAFASLHGGRIGRMVKEWMQAGGTLASFRSDYCAGGLWYTLPARQSLDGAGRATRRPTLDNITDTRGNLENHQATWHPAWKNGPPARAAPEVTGWDYTPPTLDEFEAKIDKRPITRPRVPAEQLRGR